jgi:hypothetical protein
MGEIESGENMDIDSLKTLSKSEVSSVSRNLTAIDIKFLVKTLEEKDDKLRYKAFLLLQARSRDSPIVYEYWSEFEKKLESTNSYQRSLGAMLMAENVRWDKNGKFKKAFSKYMRCCNDEKFITARQAIQSLETIARATERYDKDIRQGLADLVLQRYKENQQRLLAKDMSNIFEILKNRKKSA